MHTPDHAVMSPRQLEQSARVIHPGGWLVETHQPVATLLGSCVAVCLYDPKLRLAGMNHFLLPSRAVRDDDDPDVVLAGDYAMEVLLNAMLARGASVRRLVAKAFGGANVTSAIQTPIGERNAHFAVDWLVGLDIPLVASDLGGSWPRKVLLVPQTGDAYCRRQTTGVSGLQQLLREESRYQKTLDKDNGSRRVELF